MKQTNKRKLGTVTDKYACENCGGSGACQDCHGECTIEGEDCPVCGTTGDCVECDGTGNIVDIGLLDKSLHNKHVKNDPRT